MREENKLVYVEDKKERSPSDNILARTLNSFHICFNSRLHTVASKPPLYGDGLAKKGKVTVCNLPFSFTFLVPLTFIS